MNATGRRVIGRLAMPVAVAGILAFAGAFIFLAFTDLQKGVLDSVDANKTGPVTLGHPGFIISYISIYLASGLMLLPTLRRAFSLGITEKSVVYLTGLAVVSVLWSIEPSLTLKKSIALAGTTTFAFFLAVSLNQRQQMDALLVSTWIIVVGSICVVVLLPDIGIMTRFHEGRWNGVFAHKNILGATVAMLLPLFLVALLWRKTPALIALPGVLMAVVVLVMSASKTALLAAAAALVLLTLIFACQRRGRAMLYAVIGLSLISAAFVLQMRDDKGVPAMVNDWLEQRAAPEQAAGGPIQQPAPPNTAAPAAAEAPTLETGTLQARFELWSALLPYIEARPLLGYGFGAFWKDEQSPGYAIKQSIYWRPGHPHNGFIQLALDLGLLGSLGMLGLLAMMCWRSLRRLWAGDTSPWAVATLPVTCAIVVINLADHTLLDANKLIWTLLALMALNAAADTDRAADQARSR